jgi:hypothetical protein
LLALGTNNFKASVSTKAALRKAFPLMLNSPPILDGLFAITVTGK